MDTAYIDEAIEKYVNERKVKGKKPAVERFLSYAYLKFKGEDLVEFMKKVGGLTNYYIDYLKFAQNPFKGPEFAWFFSMILVGAASVYMICTEETRLLGILILSGTVVHAWSLICMVAEKWREAGIMIAIYRELVEIAEQEMTTLA